MTERIGTRSRAMDNQINSLEDLITKQDVKIGVMHASVKQHSDVFEMLQKSLALQQSILADMMVKLAKLEEALTKPTLLLFRPTPPLTIHDTSSHPTPLTIHHT